MSTHKNFTNCDKVDANKH